MRNRSSRWPRGLGGRSGWGRLARVTTWGALAGILLLLLATMPTAAGPADAIEELLFELQMVPLDGQTPAPFTLETLNGQQASLADFGGRVVLLYFWATW